MKDTRAGFTIVELLIVVVVIAILAAITIVSYRGITNQADNSAVQSDLSTLVKKIMVYKAENGDYPKGGSQIYSMGVKLATGSYSRGMNNGSSWYNVVYCWPNAANPDTFAIIAETKPGTVFEAKPNSGVREASYALTGSEPTCANAGVTMDNGNARDWFYSGDSWQYYAR